MARKRARRQVLNIDLRGPYASFKSLNAHYHADDIETLLDNGWHVEEAWVSRPYPGMPSLGQARRIYRTY